jgi:hypothetical protein
MANTNVISFLDSIKEIKDQTIEVILPSTSKINLKVLNLKQQKDIISCVADGITGLISFNRILNEVVANASNNNDLLSIDRVPAIIALRANAHGPNYKTTEDITIDLNAVISKFSTYKPAITAAKLEHSGVVASVKVPKLSYENSIISKLEAEVKKNGEDNSKNLGSIYIYEIIKFVENVQYNDLVINFNDLSIKDRVTILEGLPLALNKQVITFIEDLKRVEKDMLTVDSTTIEITPGFFDAE